MRKHWVKKENIYEKPFYKHKLKLTLLIVFVMAIVFFAYQLFYIKQLQIEIERKSSIVYNYEKVVDERKIIRYYNDTILYCVLRYKCECVEYYLMRKYGCIYRPIALYSA